ncbi:MAG: methyltransferase domain-containing protein [Pseudomonadota bacterium]|nr:methyltransferase domain-containing protein [Pseudomonadota bacterium]
MEYEKYHFISKPSLERHLEKIFCISKLWGIDVKLPSNSSVLELGAGTGDNLIPMAISYKDSFFIGIDKSKSQIERGNENIKKLGLGNIILLEKDFSKFKLSDIKSKNLNTKIKTFDYIIMHGVYSWVGDKVRESALKIIKKYLNKNGVSYISFNCYPGCIFRNLLIKILLKTQDKTKSLENKIKKVREDLNFLQEYLQDGNSPYASSLKQEVENISKLSDSFIVNEILNLDYKSFSLEDFLNNLKRAGLFYLSDTSFIRGFSENRKEENLKSNFENYESYIDLMFPKITRGVLVTNTSFQRKINLDAIDDFYISSPLVFSGGTGNIGEFKSPNGHSFEFETKAEVDFFKTLEKNWPKPIKLKDIECILRKKRVLDYFSKEFVNFFATNLNFSNQLENSPKVSNFAKIQLNNGDFCTNFRNEYVIFNDFQKEVFKLIDGKNTKDDILNRLIENLKNQNKYDVKVYDELKEEVEKTLRFFLETAYLK